MPPTRRTPKGLPVASALPEESAQVPIQAATKVDEGDMFCLLIRSRKALVAFGLLAAAAVAIGVGVGVSQSNKDSGSSNGGAGPILTQPLPINDETIRLAVNTWTTNKEAAIAQYGHISTWDTSNVTSLARLFFMMEDFDEDLSGWDTSKVWNQFNTFFGAKSFNGDVTTWNLTAATITDGMFMNCTAFDQDLSGWDMSNVRDTTWMFRGASAFNQDISGWNMSSVTHMVSFH